MKKEKLETQFDKVFKDFAAKKKKTEINVNSLKDKIIGMTVEKAEKLAAPKEIWLRVMKKDGVSFPGIADLRMNRINLTVENGIIIKADVG